MARSAAAKSSRKPGPERGQSTAVQTTGDITVVGAYLTIKLSTGPEHEISHDWQQSSDESSLVADLIATSGGSSVDTRGPYLLARFPNVQSAALAARRLQWASQGFSDTIDHPADLCIWLQSGEESKGEIDEQAAWQVFEEAPAGQILLSHSGAKALELLPAFLLEPGAHGDLCGLKWRAPDEQTTRKADEADIARLIALYNRSESSAESLDPANPIAGHNLGIVGGEASAGSGLGPALNRKTIFWIGGAVAAAILAVAALFFINHKSPATAEAPETKQSLPITNVDPGPKTTPGSTTGQQSSGSDQSASQAHEQPPSQSPTVDHSKNDKKHEKTPKATPQKVDTPASTEVAETPKPPPQSRGCDINVEDIPTLISQGENYRNRGMYREAQHKFNAVLNCEPSNARAREGLLQVKQAMATDKNN